MDEEDIRKQLEEKNKEIYLNKLNLDLTNNLDVLVLTIDNLLNNMEDDATNKVLSIAETFQNEKEIKNKICIFLENYRVFLMTLCNKQKEELENLIKNNKDIEQYKNFLTENNKIINNELNNYFNNNVESLIIGLQTLFSDSFCKLRIKTYLNEILKDKLNNKIIDIIKNRNIIIINTFKESYLKYLELNKNTIGVE